MNLFNKKKVAALQNELQTTSAQLDAVTKDYESLQESVMEMYNDLTEYFKPKYEGKYLKYNIENEEGVITRKVKCLEVIYDAGLINFKFELNDKRTYNEFVYPQGLRILEIITKKEFKEVEA